MNQIHILLPAGLPSHRARRGFIRLKRLAGKSLLVVILVGSAWIATNCSRPPRRIVWGDVHGHTSLSDGIGSLDDYFTFARDVAKLDFVIVTDHDFGSGPPWHMPKETWQLMQLKADQYTDNGHFIAIAGYEWTSQEKYWTEVASGIISERLFPGPPEHYGHKNVYFPGPVDSIFSAKDPAYESPDLLAEAVGQHSGLIHNAHPNAGPEGRDQFEYTPAHASIIANSEIGPDVIRWQGKVYALKMEQTLRAFLNRGGRTGFVAGSDTHDGKPEVRTAVLVNELTRSALFDALRHRHNYAVSRDRIGLDFRINGHLMGEEITVKGAPRILVEVHGTDLIREVIIVRDGVGLHTVKPASRTLRFNYVDHSFAGASYYYVHVEQTNTDEQGNPSYAWSSPIWVKTKR
jgi:hypothetical protein